MATTSEVSTALDDITRIIVQQRAIVREAIGAAASAETSLNSLAGTYADVISTLTAYTGADAWEAQVKAEFNRLATEFTDLVGVAHTIAVLKP